MLVSECVSKSTVEEPFGTGPLCFDANLPGFILRSGRALTPGDFFMSEAARRPNLFS